MAALHTCRLVVATLLAGLSGGLAVAQDGPADAGRPGDELVSASLLAEQACWLPGETRWLALAFRIEAGWHLYWKGVNDSGLPIQVALELPAGLSAGELRWTVPHRLVSPGDLLDHVYEDEAVLLLPVTVAEQAPRGEELTLVAHLRWLVCQEACLPGGADVTLTLPVAAADATPPAPAHAELFARARAALPGPPPDDLVARWHQGRLELLVPGARALELYPEAGSLALEDLLATASVRGERLLLRPDERLPGGERVRGVLRVERADGSVGHHELDLPGPPAADEAG